MITYAVVLLLVAFFSYLAQLSVQKDIDSNGIVRIQKSRDTKIFLFIVTAILTVTAGCRYYVGTDYANYIELYKDQYTVMTFRNFLEFDEPIVPLFGKISYLLFDNYFFMFFAVSVMTVGLMLYSTFKETEDYFYITLLYFFTGGWVGTFNAVRQFLAVAIVFIGRKYITERKFWKFLLVCAIAFLAHKSALFCILIYFVYSEKFTMKRLLIITVITIVVSRSYEYMFDLVGWVKDKEFIPNDYALRSVNVLRILAGCAPAVLSIYYGFTRKLDKQQLFYAYMLIVNAAIKIATGDSAYLARLALYTGVFVPLGLNSIFKATDKRYYNLLKLVAIILYMIFWAYEVIITDNLRNFQWIFGHLK